ncbi:MAG: GGDEF domain-containing protein, partial [Piscirickettsiaceae bacterium CG12_big_fil_rev_8_21_14_0_65_44_934]
SDLIWFKDAQGRFQSCNPAFETFIGQSEAEIAGKTDQQLMPEVIANTLKKYDEITLKSKKPTMHEAWLPKLNGQHEVLLSITQTALLDPDGNVYGILSVAHDITQHWEDEQHLAESQIQLEKAQSVAGIGSWTLEVSDNLLCWSNETYRIFGLPAGSPIDIASFFQRIHPDDLEMVKSTWEKAVRKQTLYEVEHRILVNDKVRWVQETCEFSFDHEGTLLRALGTVQDITERKEHEQQLQYLAHFDALTNLPNRVLLADRLHLAMHQALRRNSQLSVVYLDLDGFKEINDEYGHDVGDRLLTTIAQRMQHALRDGDTLARLGGDEFVAVLVDVQSPQASEMIFNRLLAAAYKPVMEGEHILRVSASLGATYYPQAEDIDADQLLRQADQAMYQAKLAGKNCFHLFDTQKDRLLRNYNADISSITNALTHDEFILYYQPKVNMKTGEVIGVEALIRWQHPEQGLLSPLDFLPVISGHELSIDLGNWVIKTAMQQIEYWKSINIRLPISVNIDALHLESPNFVTHLKMLLETHPNIEHGDLELEVLESSALDNLSHVSNVIKACHELGIGFALDDFGTGYSSLIYLKRLPANLIKIDQGFVRDMLEDTEDLAIIQGVLGLSNAFGRDTIAEGVETILHGERLLKLGCLLGQGYGIARPMPAEEIENWLKTWQPDASWTQ